MVEVSDVKPKQRGRRRIVVPPPISQEQLETITAPINNGEEARPPGIVREPLNLKMPFATRKQQLSLLAKTQDGKLVFQGQRTGKVITTDAYGFLVDGPKIGHQLVFNGIPEELRKWRARTKFLIGEVIFTVRPMARNRKVYAGVVESFDPKGVVLRVLGAIDKDKFSQARTRADGHVVVPYNLCFKTPEQISMFIHKFQHDFDRSKTDYRQLIENSRQAVH